MFYVLILCTYDTLSDSMGGRGMVRLGRGCDVRCADRAAAWGTKAWWCGALVGVQSAQRSEIWIGAGVRACGRAGVRACKRAVVTSFRASRVVQCVHRSHDGGYKHGMEGWRAVFHPLPCTPWRHRVITLRFSRFTATLSAPTAAAGQQDGRGVPARESIFPSQRPPWLSPVYIVPRSHPTILRTNSTSSLCSVHSSPLPSLPSIRSLAR